MIRRIRNEGRKFDGSYSLCNYTRKCFESLYENTSVGNEFERIHMKGILKENKIVVLNS